MAIFDAISGAVIEVNLQGTLDDVLTIVASQQTVQKRGIQANQTRAAISAEVTLLPRHWDWLATQSGGASAALRRLVDIARHSHQAADRQRHARESCYRFMTVMAGDRSGFEAATRALFSDDGRMFAQQIAPWPEDIRQQVARFAAPVWNDPAHLPGK